MTTDHPEENQHQDDSQDNLQPNNKNTAQSQSEEVDTTQSQNVLEEAIQKNKKYVASDIFKLFISLKNYLALILNLKEGADIPGTIEGIKKDIDFTGHKAWILILSIFIASIGLNVNSTAVIIGAMLISPLMGPILGAGLAVGVNDPETFSRSIRNLLTAVGISLATSTLYFLISPIDTADSELLARTEPTILDVLIAFFGGAAGIIAGSRSEKSNVVPGVAIATALMPPLCTAGFGLANGEWQYFLGAFYLFTLNSIFIWLATYLLVKFINFPKVQFVNPEREKKYKRYIIASIIIIILPSAWLFWGVLKEQIFETRANQFLKENLEFKSKKTRLADYSLHYEENTIDVVLVGKPISEETRLELELKLPEYGIEGGILHVTQNEESKVNDSEFQIRVYESKEIQIFKQDSIIKSLAGQINLMKSDTIPLTNLEKEINVLHPGISSFSYAPLIESDMKGKRDTIPTFLIVWNPESDIVARANGTDNLQGWLRARLNDQKIQVISY